MKGIDVKLIIILLIIYLIINYILFSVAMYFILRKEKKNVNNAFIPFVHAYEYLKICQLPFILLFVPICNIVMLFLSPIKFCRMYRCGKFLTFLGVLFPTIVLNYIAFSDLTNKKILLENRYLPTQKDVDELDKRLIDLSHGIKPPEEKDYILFRTKKTQKDTMIGLTAEEFVDDVEKKAMVANINEDSSRFEEIHETIEIMEEEKKIEKQEEVKEAPKEINQELDETLDDVGVDATIRSLETIDTIENKQINNEKQDTGVDTNEYKNFEKHQASNEAIAFGGADRKEEVESVQSKNEKLKCPRCGSSLVGANGFCPGCGMKI